MGTTLKSPKVIKPIKLKYWFDIYIEDQKLEMNILQKDQSYEAYEFDSYFQIESTDISCGVKQVHELPSDFSFNDIKKQFSQTEFKKVITEFFISILNACKENEKSAFIILSCCLIKGYSITNEVLGKICAKTEVRENPNTGNNIIIYIY